MRENLGGVVVRLGVFLAVCLLTAFLLIAVFGEVRFGDDDDADCADGQTVAFGEGFHFGAHRPLS